MKMEPRQRLLEVLRAPAELAQLTLEEWDRLIPWGNETLLLSSLAESSVAWWPRFPPEVIPHLEAARRKSWRQQRAVRWEVTRLERSLASVDTPIILLKGAAYLLSGRQAARGRVHNDIDILVRREKLDEVERSLLAHGWEIAEDDPRHQLYFRRWLHELPPMQHAARKMVLDVHHTILPRTDALRLDPERLLAAARPIEPSGGSPGSCRLPSGSGGLDQVSGDESRSLAAPSSPAGATCGGRVAVLQPVDMVLHSAAHLFRNGDFSHGLRDLFDLDALIREFASDDLFWNDLLARAEQLDLRLPCFLGLRYVERFFATPVPDATRRAVAPWRPRHVSVGWLDQAIDRACLPRRLDGKDFWGKVAIAGLSFWPLPRPRAMMTALFWTKRLPRRKPAARPVR